MKARRLILHLGHGKTGSTSIQRALRASNIALSEAGILFPDPGRHDNHQLLFPHFWGVLPDDPVQRASLGRSGEEIRNEAARRYDALKARVAADRPETIVLSCENQFRPFPAEAVASARRLCADLAEQTEIIVYLRSPASFALSKIQQDVKKRPEFLYVTQTRIRDVLEPLLNGALGALTSLRFDRDTLIGADAVTDFVTRMLPGLDPAALTRGTAEENTSISAEGMALLQDLFRETRALPAFVKADKKAFRKIIVASDSALEGFARPRLHDSTRAVIEARVTETPWLAETLDIRFPDLHPPTMSPAKAEEAYLKLRDIDQICPVDTDRKEALWQLALDRARSSRGPLARLVRALRG